ncbi:Williams-Beuren syndrome chromosomal region 27 protein [Plakobranchus ocellatus]|uniref:Williams-Beuren syndrome chromosomal region 27 protein n=1 Tax=Plakobranchus ocellatus TaxID=259542 RepID=A0AAV4D954_9GAST|nr:Williams-Beuren syndrome chromosomal region 27 protein [Plakobranchus ocellatus]
MSVNMDEPFTAVDDVEAAMYEDRGMSFHDSQALYNKWASDGTYDEMLNDNPEEYNGLYMFTSGVKTLFDDVAKVRVLDVGAGSGLSGEKLLSVGYTNIDALEPCENFVQILRKKGIYKNIIHSSIGSETPVNIPDDTYDAVVITGSFGPGHIPCAAIPEAVRIVKPGGFFLNCMREEYLYDVPEYKDRLVPLLQDLEKQGRIQKLEWTVYPKHFHGKDGIRMIYKVL